MIATDTYLAVVATTGIRIRGNGPRLVFSLGASEPAVNLPRAILTAMGAGTGI
jgi:hypothetical protein